MIETYGKRANFMGDAELPALAASIESEEIV